MNVSIAPVFHSPIFSFKLTAVLVGISQAILAGAFLLATGPLFGTTYTLMVFGGTLLTLIMLSLLFAKANGDINRPAETAFFVAAFALLGVAMALGTTSRFQDSLTAERAILVVEAASQNLGRPAQSTDAVRAASSSRQSAAANREFLRAIRQGVVAKEEVTQYLVGARLLGVDASFVVQNAIVRKQDEQVLFQTAIKKAQAGDEAAAQWLSSNPVATR